MTKQRKTFAAFLAEQKRNRRPVLLDGATGTELDNRGAHLFAPLWSGAASLETPELLSQIHRDYARAGADILTSCTFRTTARAFAKAGFLDDRWKHAATEAVRLARDAANEGQYVAGSVAPLEDCFIPERAPKGAAAVDEHRLFCETLVNAGVDVLWLETFGTLGELEAAMEAAKTAGENNFPFGVSVTTRLDGKLISGESLQAAMEMARAAGALSFSINCVPVTHVEAALPLLSACEGLAVGAYANLGVAEPTQDWRGSAHLSPEAYAEAAAKWPLDIVGGCCGSTPAHIVALRRLLKGNLRGNFPLR